MVTETTEEKSPLTKFKELTIAHPLLKEAYEELQDEIREPGDAAMIFVFGPTGVGKTTILKKIYANILEDEKERMEQDRGSIPIIKVEARATDTGKFPWKGFYKNMLKELKEPLINKKTNLELASIENFPKPSGTLDDLRSATEESLKKRKTKIVLIDEAQHMTKIKSSKKLEEVLDCIKSFSNTTGVIYILFGTYELSATRNLSAQLIRRSIDIHFRRYKYENDEDKKNFIRCIAQFQNIMPVEQPPNLLEHWKYLYTGSIGCIGILKKWMDKALSRAVKDKSRTVTIEHFKKTAKNVEQLVKIAQETCDGEKEFLTSTQDYGEVEAILGLSEKTAPKEKPIEAAVAKQKPFVRKPVRDIVGG